MRVPFRKDLDPASRAMEVCKADTIVVALAEEDHDCHWFVGVAAVVEIT